MSTSLCTLRIDRQYNTIVVAPDVAFAICSEYIILSATVLPIHPSGRYGTSPMQSPAEVFLCLRSFLSGVRYSFSLIRIPQCKYWIGWSLLASGPTEASKYAKAGVRGYLRLTLSLTTGQESCFLTSSKLTFPVRSNTCARGQQRRPRKPVATVGRTRWHSMFPLLLLALRHPLPNGRPKDSPSYV